MQSEHDRRAPQVFDDRALAGDHDFIGPLRPADQAWADSALRTDTEAAQREPVDIVIRRREAHVGDLYRMATLLTLSGDLAGGGAAGFRAVAESRALTEFLTTSPAYCLDCFLLGERCASHGDRQQASGATSSGTRKIGPGSSSGAGPGTGSGSGAGPGFRAGPGREAGRPHRPEWRRFGAEEFPSAGG